MSTTRIGFGVIENFKKNNLLNKVTQKVTKKEKPQIYKVTDCLDLIEDLNRSLGAVPEIEQLVIEPEAYIKLMCFINLIGDYEISGFARILPDKPEEKRFKVVDFDILKQEVRGAYVESTADAVIDFIKRIPKTQIKEWTLDWHSHVNMATSPSTTDWNNYKEMLQARMYAQFPIMIVNKSENITSYQILSREKHEPIKVFIRQLNEPLPAEKVEEIYNTCKEQIEKLCIKYEATTYPCYSSYTTNYNSDEYDTIYNWNTKEFEQHEKKNISTFVADETEDTDDDDELSYYKKQGYVFDKQDYVGSSTKENLFCEVCGQALVTDHEKDLGVCEACFQEFNK